MGARCDDKFRTRRTSCWDLVVLDEAHRLRNVYKPGNIIANTLKTALHLCHIKELDRQIKEARNVQAH